jgi:phosphoribosyl-ATP pyrophosphohydrolase
MKPGQLETLERIAAAIEERKGESADKSYVASLFAKGEDAMLKKIGEEATEVVVAASTETRERLVSEVADLWFHTLVLLGARGIPVREVFAELARRHAAGRGA